MKARLGYDDSLDAFGVHGIGGLTGTLGAGLFASLAINPGGADGLFMGNPQTLLVQAKAIGAVALYSVGGTLFILKALDKTVGLRVHEDHEVEGLDLSQHSEEGYFLS
jgi:Amt family ammonium transporter